MHLERREDLAEALPRHRVHQLHHQPLGPVDRGKVGLHDVLLGENTWAFAWNYAGPPRSVKPRRCIAKPSPPPVTYPVAVRWIRPPSARTETCARTGTPEESSACGTSCSCWAVR